MLVSIYIYQWYMTNPVSPHPCQHLMLSLFWILAVLCVCVCVCVCVCSESSLWSNLHFPNGSIVEQFGVCVLICLPHFLFGEMSVHVFCPFSNWIACFFTLEVWGLSLYPRYQFFYRYMTSKYFLQYSLISIHVFQRKAQVLTNSNETE